MFRLFLVPPAGPSEVRQPLRSQLLGRLVVLCRSATVTLPAGVRDLHKDYASSVSSASEGGGRQICNDGPTNDTIWAEHLHASGEREKNPAGVCGTRTVVERKRKCQKRDCASELLWSRRQFF